MLFTLKLRNFLCGLVCLLSLTKVEAAGSSIEECQTQILVSVFGTLVFCVVVFGSILFACLLTKRKKKETRHQNGNLSGHQMNDIEGRRNRVFEDDKDIDEYSGVGRKRQDSGFIASSNESIIPFPEIYQSSGPKRSPSMPNLRVTSSNNEQQRLKVGGKSEGDVFICHDQQKKQRSSSKPKMVSIGVSTRDPDHNMNHKIVASDSKSTNDLHYQQHVLAPKKPETVVIQKRSFNCTGIDFGIGGVFVKDFDRKDISFKKGELFIGDEIISINDYPLRGLTDMEAFSFFAKSGPEVKLKIVRGVYLDKADGVSVTDFQLSEMSSDLDEDLPCHIQYAMKTNSQTTPTAGMTKSGLRQSLNRLPRVIADANNLSFDGCDMDMLSPVPDCLLLKTVYSNNNSHSDSSSSSKHQQIEPTVTGDEIIQKSFNKPNGVKSNVALESQEITKILLANPNLFMEFLETVQGKDKACGNRTSRRNSDTSECRDQHSRHTSCERSRQHSRHSSNGQSQNTIGQTYNNNNTKFGATDLRPNRCSCDSQRFISLPNEEHLQNSNRLNRTNTSDDLVSSGSPLQPYSNEGRNTFRSHSSVDGSSQIFTIDSYSRNMEQNYNQRHSIDIDTALQQQPCDQQRLYYHEVLKQKSSLEQPPPHQQNNSNELTPLGTPNNKQENVVVQRRYNNDYIIPLIGPSFANPAVSSNFAASPTKPIHRNVEGSPVRRTSPSVAFPPQNVPRFQQPVSTINNTVITSGSVDYRVDSPSSPKTSVSSISSSQGGQVVGLLPRKPPPNYASIQRKTPSDLGSEDESSTTSQRETVNIDADFMWKMKQKYCEPRIRKNPPPSYNASVSDIEGGVIMRKKTSKTFNRSRPHSYTETGIAMLGDGGTMNLNRVIQPTSLSMDNADLERRKHPKRTHSMPAVKQTESRPVAAQSFLVMDQQQPLSFDGDTTPVATYPPHYSSLPPTTVSQQPPQYSQHHHHHHYPQPSTLHETTQNVEVTPYTTQATISAAVAIDGTEQKASDQLTNEYEQASKKLRTRQQRAEDSFNRRKSIDSGTLRKLAEEMHENPAFGGEYPILSQLLGESQFTAIERRSQALYRYKSTEALYSQF